MPDSKNKEESAGSGESKPVSLERDVATVMETISHTVVLTGLVLFGILLDFIAEVLKLGVAPAYPAGQVLAAIGTFLIAAVLFVSGMTKRTESDMVRFGLLLAAAIVFISIPSMIG